MRWRKRLLSSRKRRQGGIVATGALCWKHAYQCGGFDHLINVDHLTFENRPIRVPNDICERMV